MDFSLFFFLFQVISCSFFFSSRRRHTRLTCDWSSDVCSSDLLADVAFVAGESTLDEIPLHFVEAHLLQLGRPAKSLRAQAEVCRANGRAGREEHAAFHRVIELPNIAWPGMFMKSLHGGRVETGNVFAIALRVTVDKMVRKEIDVLAAVSQRRDVDLDGIQA